MAAWYCCGFRGAFTTFWPETKRPLKEKAGEGWPDLEAYVQALAEQDALTGNGTRLGAAPLTSGQRSAEWQAWANADRQLPAGLSRRQAGK